MDGDEFLRRMRARDDTLWEELMPMLRRLVLGACRDFRIPEALKDDIVQDVLLRIFTQWQSYGGQSALTTWFYAVARNRCLDELRKRKVRGEDLKRADDEQRRDGEEAVPLAASDPGNLAQMLCVQQMLAELDAQGQARRGSHRIIDVLLYCVQHDPTTEELARFLQTTVAAAKERKRAIRERIKALCREFCGDDDCSMSDAVSAP